MHPREPYPNGSRRFPYEDPQLGSFDSTPSALPDSGQLSAASTVAVLESVFLNDGHMMPGDGVPSQLDGHDFPRTDEYINDSQVETEKYRGPSVPTSSYDSDAVSDSTFASSTLAEQVAESAENFDNINFDSIFSWPPEVLGPAYEDQYSFMYGAPSPHCQEHHASASDGNFHAEEPVTNPGTLEVRRKTAAKTWPRFVRVVCACHRFRAKALSKRGINGKRKRSAESSGKNSCEIRISKKIPTDGKHLKEKVWLGTYPTPEQSGRAKDVGKYFLSTKKKKTFSDPKSEGILSAFKDRVHALPLTELVETVTKLAKHYGKTGSLPESLSSL